MERFRKVKQGVAMASLMLALAGCGQAASAQRAQADGAADAIADQADPPPMAEATSSPVPQAQFAPDDADIAALTRLLAPAYADFREIFPDAQDVPSFRAAAFDLDGDGSSELLVRLEGRSDCGSGGCTFRVYQRTPEGLRKVSGTTLTFLPIGVAGESSQGWRDIILSVRGDYVEGGKARLRHAGGTYPLNPTMPPVEPADDFGTIVLSEGSPLHPLTD